MLITKNVKEENFKQKDKKIGNQVTKNTTPKRLLLDKSKKVFLFYKKKIVKGNAHLEFSCDIK